MGLDEEFTLEKLQLAERIRQLEIQVARLVAHTESEQGTFARIHQQINDQTTQMAKIIERHDKILLGNGTVGLITKLDRLEQSDDSKRWNLRVVWGAIIVGLVKMGLDVVKP